MKKFRIIAIFIALASGLAALVAFGNPARPEIVFAKALRNLESADAFSAAITVGAFAPPSIVHPGAADDAVVPIVMAGTFDANVAATRLPSVRGRLALSQGVKSAGPANVAVQFAAPADGAAYVSFSGGAATAGKFKNDVVDGAWYAIDGKTFAAMFGADAGAPSGPNDALVAWRTLRAFAIAGAPYAIIKTSPSEFVNGSSAWHYTVAIDPDAAADLAVDALAFLRGAALSPAEEQKVRADAATHPVTVEAWIDKNSGRFRRVDVTVENAAAGISSIYLEFEKWNDAPAIAAPAHATPLPALAHRPKAGG